MISVRRILHLGALWMVGVAFPVLAQTSADVPTRQPDAVVDLATAQGTQLVKGTWRYSETRIVEAAFRAPDVDGQPTGAPIKTYDFEPHAGAADFDDAAWEALDPTTLSARRSTGRLCFNWYRIQLTVPQSIGSFSTKGAEIAFETSVDDYAEIWVNGELSRSAGQSGGSVIAGWNATNRVIISRSAMPSQKIQLAIFGINGPLSNPPTNFIWLRFARLLFFADGKAPVAITPSEVNIEVKRLDPEIDNIVPENAKLYKLADGFQFTEGPVWIGSGNCLLFSDPNANRIYKYSPKDGLSVYREKSGYDGADIAEYGQPGSNGITVDPEGRLTVNQHGNRRVIRLEPDGTETVLVDKFEGKRLNSPNDLVYRSDGTLYVTDPPFGLPKFHADPRKELPFEGVFAVKDGSVRLVARDFRGPNGIAFSPDEKYLYVGNWEDNRKIVMRYPVNPDGSLQPGTLFFDMTSAPGEDAIDGMKIDERGDLFVSGPGGIWVLSPEGKHLGTIVTPMHAHNFNWGDDDHQTLYIAARSGLYRMHLKVRGAGIPK